MNVLKADNLRSEDRKTKRSEKKNRKCESSSNHGNGGASRDRGGYREKGEWFGWNDQNNSEASTSDKASGWNESGNITAGGKIEKLKVLTGDTIT
ncbi:hypothetical protein MJO28_009082 [Puccinia striiformis f. sp. tritici]|uniref:Uncharacterized protein n=1 Tax=Puccinia striiformis f. sp. tritici TaxID=168172 RepID=A0ACC0E682_9BASI|nr:hypothetical protein MJO28_009082 [Puccinia striiformis f. sp. tritici]